MHHHHPYWALAIVSFILSALLLAYCVWDTRRDRNRNDQEEQSK